jgi:hypothetical protein
MPIRRFLSWLLMLAIPLQGIAASTMLLCGPSLDRQQVAVEAVHDHHAPHDGASAAHSHDRHHADADADAADTAAGSGTHSPASADHPKAKCSVCASCCSGVAIVATPLTTAVSEQHESYTVFLATDFEPVFIAGPEKPPRSFLA